MDSNYRGNTRFDREQLIFVADTILIGALDRIESGLPTSITAKDRAEFAHEGIITRMSSYDQGALHTAGMALAVFYAQLTDDGLGIGDALHCAGKFDDAVENLVFNSWLDEGKGVRKKEDEFRSKNQGYTMDQVLPEYPDSRKHAEAFVDGVFKEYLAGLVPQETPMPTFEVTREGYNPESSDPASEDCVWWFKAPNVQVVETFLNNNPRKLADNATRYLAGRDEQISVSEVDIVLNAHGEVVKSSRPW